MGMGQERSDYGGLEDLGILFGIGLRLGSRETTKIGWGLGGRPRRSPHVHVHVHPHFSLKGIDQHTEFEIQGGCHVPQSAGQGSKSSCRQSPTYLVLQVDICLRGQPDGMRWMQ